MPISSGEATFPGAVPGETVGAAAPGFLADSTRAAGAVVQFTRAGAGTLAYGQDGSFSYKQPADFVGVDAFWWRLANPDGSYTAEVALSFAVGPPPRVVRKTGNYALSPREYDVVYTAGMTAAATLTLPDVAALDLSAVQTRTVKREPGSGYNVVIQGYSGQAVDGGASYTLTGAGNSVQFRPDGGGGWFVS